MKRLVALTLICCFIAGCATIPKLSAPLKREESFSMSFDTVWPALVTIVTEGGNIVNVADKDSGIITYRAQLPRKQLEDYLLQKPPAFPIGAYYGSGEAHVTLRVQPLSEEKTNVRITSQIKAQLHNMFGEPLLYSGSHNLNSNGRLEEDVFKMISSQIGTTKYKWLESQGKEQE